MAEIPLASARCGEIYISNNQEIIICTLCNLEFTSFATYLEHRRVAPQCCMQKVLNKTLDNKPATTTEKKTKN